ncbi:EGF-like domain-containing protein, putative [Eimeria brunetti]|uniref:EGF-like domain-containing protein, putative n=1 Tax=Eimeria brunetti TaxID=51314 RepID=U6LIV4_9EIME|nr:EGF-like domain-containing protein, putative [Eimeria brunetti]
MSQSFPLCGLLAQLFLISTLFSIPSSCHTVQNRIAANDYMNRFNIPANHIHLEWAKSGSGLQSYVYKGTTYKWLPRSQTAGVKVGYATMWDRSSKGYCTRSDAEIDTQRYLGQRLMAVGACPNYGKYIAFVDRSGKPADDQDRFTNEIHGNTMPFSTQGCSSSASPGKSEVPMDKSGWSMYSGYLVKCPFNQAVYQNDMLQDAEYDPAACSFVTLDNPLVFLDTSLPGSSLADKAYAFHGKGGHQGYDFIGNGVGCPPYSPPVKTRSMKSPSLANDPFLCSQLSRCTSMCWPWDTKRPCYRSLPASFNHSTSECLILGYHTQTYMGSNCAVKTATDSNAKYCVKAHKTVASSNYTYVSAFTRPDYETACPPREPLKNVVFGTVSRGVCTQLEVASSSAGTAGECGEAVFEASSDDSPSGTATDMGRAKATSASAVRDSVVRCVKLELVTMWIVRTAAPVRCPAGSVAAQKVSRGRAAKPALVKQSFVRTGGNGIADVLSAIAGPTATHMKATAANLTVTATLRMVSATALTRYTGEDCTEMSSDCSELCKVGGDIIRDSEGECSLDCYSTCCKYLTGACSEMSEEEKEQCIRDSLGATEEEACCLARVEEGSNAAIYAAIGLVVALLLLGGAGGMYYKSSSGSSASGSPQEEPVGETVGGTDRPARAESAISVDFEDYASTPDDATGDIHAEGEAAQDAEWDDGMPDFPLLA